MLTWPKRNNRCCTELSHSSPGVIALCWKLLLSHSAHCQQLSTLTVSAPCPQACL